MTREQLIKAFDGIIRKWNSENFYNLTNIGITQLATALVDSVGVDEEKVQEVVADSQLKHFNGVTMPAKKFCESHLVIAKAISTSDILTVKGSHE